MKVIFLGTGTSQGIPVIACKCATCTSSNPKDKRLRTAVYLEVEGKHICIDVGPDFRQQMLGNHVDQLDAVLLTHEHNDHMIGADDLRPFNFLQRKDMPIFGEDRVLEEVKNRFEYAFKPHPYPGIPRFLLTAVDEDEIFTIDDVKIEPVRIYHGALPIFGYRIKDFCYLTDVKTIPDREFVKLQGLEVVVLNALQKRQHHSHMTLEEALVMAERIGAKRTYLTHFSHSMGPLKDWEDELPEGVFASFDGLTLNL